MAKRPEPQYVSTRCAGRGVVAALVGDDGVPNVVGQQEQDGVDVLEERASVVLDLSRGLVGRCGITPSAKLKAFQISHGLHLFLLLKLRLAYMSSFQPDHVLDQSKRLLRESEVRLSVSVIQRVDLTPCSERFNATMTRLSMGKTVTRRRHYLLPCFVYSPQNLSSGSQSN